MSAKHSPSSSDTLPYRGRDRRSRTSSMISDLPARHVVLLTLMVCAGAGAPALFLLSEGPSAPVVTAYLSVAAGLLAVVAGGTALVSWRVTGRSLQGWMGTALITFGVLTLVHSALTDFGANGRLVNHSFDNLVIAAVAGWLVGKAATDTEVNAGFAPFTTLVASIGTGVFVMGMLNLLQAEAVFPRWMSGVPAGVTADAAAASIWLIVAVITLRRAGRSLGVPVGLAFLIGYVGLAAALRAPDPTQWGPAFAASLLVFVVTAAALGAAMARIQAVLRSEDRHQLGLRAALDAARRQVQTDQDELEVWLHDLRNAVAGLQAADAVLRAGAEPGVAARTELAMAVTAELTRLRALVEPAHGLHLSEVDLERVLGPLVEAERALGTDVEAQVRGVHALADPEALSRVVQNILCNARRYAPGAPVELTARQWGSHVVIAIRDHGPGIPAHEHVAVFDRGARGSSSSGTQGNGLGLYVARQLVEAMGGRIRLEQDGLPGCHVMLELPSSGRPAAQPAERHDEVLAGAEPGIGARDQLRPAS